MYPCHEYWTFFFCVNIPLLYLPPPPWFLRLLALSTPPTTSLVVFLGFFFWIPPQHHPNNGIFTPRGSSLKSIPLLPANNQQSYSFNTFGFSRMVPNFPPPPDLKVLSNFEFWRTVPSPSPFLCTAPPSLLHLPCAISRCNLTDPLSAGHPQTFKSTSEDFICRTESTPQPPFCTLLSPQWPLTAGCGIHPQQHIPPHLSPLNHFFGVLMHFWFTCTINYAFPFPLPEFSPWSQCVTSPFHGSRTHRFVIPWWGWMNPYRLVGHTSALLPHLTSFSHRIFTKHAYR